MRRLRGPGGITVEAVEYEDRLGYKRRVLRARQYETHLGDFSSVEALAKVIDVSALVEEDDDQADEEGPVSAINVVFDGPGPEGGKLVDVETDDGRSLRIGEWVERPDGTWALRITELPGDAPPGEDGAAPSVRSILGVLLPPLKPVD